MCYPWLFAAAGTALQVSGGMQNAEDAKAAGERDALIGEQQATDAIARGGLEEERYRRDLSRIIGSQKAEIGARNVRGNSGTALDLLNETEEQGEAEVATIRNEFAREAYGYRSGADQARRGGRQRARAYESEAAASALTGAANAYGYWKQR